MFKNALVSVSDKTGLVDFLRPLVAQGLRIVSTGGTAKYLLQNDIPVVQVHEQTGFPEVMDGRVRTLHPRIHIPLLARDEVAEDQELLRSEGLAPFDLVVCNLYPFAQALTEKNLLGRDLIEYIDIGGPSLLRAAAKSFSRITVLCDPADYARTLQQKNPDEEFRRSLASKVFAHTGAYDAMVAEALGVQPPAPLAVGGNFVQKLRYGENPQQEAVWYRRSGARIGLHQATILQGKELSYNNLLDLDAAVRAVRCFKERSAAVAVKHNNLCGVGVGGSVGLALERALRADPVSVFGGIVAMNGPVDLEMARHLGDIFLECIVAPHYSDQALQILAKKKNLRVLSWPQMLEDERAVELRTISGGYLAQSQDFISTWTKEWEIIGAKPSEDLRQAIGLAWKVCSQLKSNAIAIADHHLTLGLGMGQVNRVEAVEQAIGRWQQHHPERTNGVVLASDAFFPFADSIEKAAAAGIRWVVQPGGSVRDREVFTKAEELGVNLVLTRVRHFRH